MFPKYPRGLLVVLLFAPYLVTDLSRPAPATLDLFCDQALADAATQFLSAFSKRKWALMRLEDRLLPLGPSEPREPFQFDGWRPDHVVRASAATVAARTAQDRKIPAWLDPWIERARMGAVINGIKLIVRSEADFTIFKVINERKHEKNIIWEPINNALKYTKRGGRITISFEQDGSDAIFAVEDTGIGLTSVEKGLIWQLGYRGLRASLMSEWGIGGGLGMSYLRRAVEDELKGQGTAESAGANKGMTLTVRIPIQTRAGLTVLTRRAS